MVYDADMETQYQLGWVTGWMERWAEAEAIERFHRYLRERPLDSPEMCWRTAMAEARTSLSYFDSLSDKEKLARFNDPQTHRWIKNVREFNVEDMPRFLR